MVHGSFFNIAFVEDLLVGNLKLVSDLKHLSLETTSGCEACFLWRLDCWSISMISRNTAELVELNREHVCATGPSVSSQLNNTEMH